MKKYCAICAGSPIKTSHGLASAGVIGTRPKGL